MSAADSTDEPGRIAWSAGAVARRLGISPTTLRTWHHRYGLGPAPPRPGRHRRYTEHDIAALQTMTRLVAQGMVPTAAAEIARTPVDAMPGRSDRGDASDYQDGPTASISAAARQGLVAAALRLDSLALHHGVNQALTTHGLDLTWNQLCVPVLTTLGRRVTADGNCIEAILLLSNIIITGLHHLAGVPAPDPHTGLVVLACADGERHSLGLEVLNAALIARRVPTHMLGTSVPTAVLESAARQSHPAAVVVWSQARRTARPGALHQLASSSTLLIAAGPGWSGAGLPPAVTRPTTLAHALDAITAVAQLPNTATTTDGG